jgi:hypothetical protein
MNSIAEAHDYADLPDTVCSIINNYASCLQALERLTLDYSEMPAEQDQEHESERVKNIQRIVSRCPQLTEVRVFGRKQMVPSLQAGMPKSIQIISS